MNYRAIFNKFIDLQIALITKREVLSICNRKLDQMSLKQATGLDDINFDLIHDRMNIKPLKYHIGIDKKTAMFLLHTKIGDALEFVIWGREEFNTMFTRMETEQQVKAMACYEVEFITGYENIIPVRKDILLILLTTLEMEYMEFDKDKYEQLKKAYDTAVSAKLEMFVFEGKELMTNYAKYLLEYLSTSLA